LKEKRLEKMERIERPDSLPNKMRILLSPKRESGNDVLDVDSATMQFDGQLLFSSVSFSIKKGDKAALIGPNGIGKTTLLRMITGELPTYRGKINLGVNVKIGYYDQEHAIINSDKTIFAEINDSFPQLTNTEIRNVLAAFIFTGDDVFKPISTLSGGERGRVALAKIMLSGANFLMLDEPTNHLDMASKEILEEALRDYSGTILYISHDRYFINHTANKILEMKKDGVTLYRGTYDFYLEKKRSAAVFSRENEKSKIDATAPSKRKISKNQKNKLDKLERLIEETELELQEIEQKLSSEEIGRDAEMANEFYTKKINTETYLRDLYEEWDKLSEDTGGESV
jgi:ATP-binding cassette subfamily F protein 3